MPLFFHTEKIHFPFNKRRQYTKWIDALIEKHDRSLGVVNIIFTSNDHLLTINRDYLNHHYFTDVITFDYTEENLISGDIFVSIDQVKLNSLEFKTTFELELARVVIHGVLHLLDFKDSSEEEASLMREKEEEALELFNMLENGKPL